VSEPAPKPGAPTSTYRVQLNANFTFHDVAGIAGYLADLGISHVYCPPYLQAHTGSTHGYDVVDHSRLSEELGGPAGFERMVTALREHGLSHIVDIVPNHVSVAGRTNRAWWDVLKKGRASRYAGFFDIEWERVSADLIGKVLVPILGDETDAVVERGEIEVNVEGEEPVVRYFEHELPVADGTLPTDTSLPSTDPELVRALLNEQHYVLAHWRRARRHLNYRRFFDINTLAALRMEQPGVFEETHELILGLIREGKLDGLRVDHIDGLYDPAAYLQRLRDEAGGYIVVEKILEPGEELPEWPIEGTTGYDFMNVVGGLYVDPLAENRMHDIYESFIGEQVALDRMTLEKKYLLMRNVMVSDITRLNAQLKDVFSAAGWNDLPEVDNHLRDALCETIASFHVYRTYVSSSGAPNAADVQRIRRAIEEAKPRRTYIDARIFDRIEEVLLLEAGGEPGRAFAMRFQQTTGPIMAKSVEDTVFYNFNRLVALNEVGGDPGRFGIGPAAFHVTARRAQETWPLSMTATSTHDTKRGEDTRLRISALSEIPDAWAAAVARWGKIAERHRSDEMPDLNAIYLLFQTLVGAWPLETERAVAYMQKASKEAKRYTSWTDPVPAYDEALEAFVRALLADEEFTRDLEALVEPLIVPARRSSLAQTLIRLTYPGVPDTYQGTELWAHTLVDPDNRRPVDHAARRELLAEIDGLDARELWPDQGDGRAKLLVTARALAARKKSPDAFGADSAYEPLVATGSGTEHVVAYLRGPRFAVLTTRLNVNVDRYLPGTTVELAPGEWTDAFTGRSVAGGVLEVPDLLDAFPVALLEKAGPG
jgi:(1->4)-alpha-D-glucan 1-alpha-D-glucosylmutase